MQRIKKKKLERNILEVKKKSVKKGRGGWRR
jgi:hypothetical protein